MNWDQIVGNWKQFEGKVQHQWGKLTDDDLAQAKGDQKVLAGKISRALRRHEGRSRAPNSRMAQQTPVAAPEEGFEMAPLFKPFTNWTPPHLARGF